MTHPTSINERAFNKTREIIINEALYFHYKIKHCANPYANLSLPYPKHSP